MSYATITRPAGVSFGHRHGWLLRLFALYGGIFALVSVVPSSALVVCGAAALYAVRGPRQTIEALTVLGLLILVGSSGSALGRWLVLFAGFGRMVWDTLGRSGGTPASTGSLLAFVGVMLLFSVGFSMMPLVSSLKLITFGVGAFTVLTAFHRTAPLVRHWWSWFFAFVLFVVVASVPFYGLAAGYERNGVGFQGITMHPQTFGPFCALAAAFFGSVVLFGSGRSRLALVGLFLSVVHVLASQARTALFAVLGGLAVVVFVALLRQGTWGALVRQAVLRPVVVVPFFVLCVAAVAYSAQLQQEALAFLIKDDGATQSLEAARIMESLSSSREHLIVQSMENFRAHPLTGIGFGVPSTPEDALGMKMVMGLPLGASVEKGFMPSAVLEETGIVGAILVLALLGALVVPVVRTGSVGTFWLFTTGLLINMGEMVFFSFGGFGLVVWLFFGFCYADATARRRTAPRSQTLHPRAPQPLPPHRGPERRD